VPQLWLPKAFGGTAATFDYYISTTGSDSNAGTLAAPWAITSFQNTSANNSKMAGKRIGLIAGTYSTAGLSSSHGTDYTWNLMNIPGGTSSASTYVGSSDTSGNYSARAATIVAGTAGTNYLAGLNPIMGSPGSQISGKGSYITIDGIVFNGNNMDYSSNQSVCHILSFYGVYNSATSVDASETGILIQNCELYGIRTTSHAGGNSALIFFEGIHDSVVQNNYLHDVGSTAALDLGHVHGTQEYGCRNNQWIYNTLYNCCSGIDCKNSSTGSTVAYNYLYQCGSVAAAAQGGGSPISGWDGYAEGGSGGSTPPYITGGPGGLSNISAWTYLIHHNILDSCVGCSDIEQAPWDRLIPISIWNNTVYETYTGGIWGWEVRQASPTGGLTFYNNIFQSAGTGTYSGISGKLGVTANNNVEIDYNCWYKPSGAYTAWWGIGVHGSTTTYGTFAAWQSAIQGDLAGAEAHSFVSNPTFSTTIVAGAGPTQFQLGSGSPCLGTGLGGANLGAWDGTTTQIGCNFAT